MLNPIGTFGIVEPAGGVVDVTVREDVFVVVHVEGVLRDGDPRGDEVGFVGEGEGGRDAGGALEGAVGEAESCVRGDLS